MTAADLDRIYTPTTRVWDNLILLEVVRLGTSNKRNRGAHTAGTKTHLVRVSYIVGFVDDEKAALESNEKTLGARYYRMRESERENYGKPWFFEADPVVFSAHSFCYTNGQHAASPSKSASEVTCAKCAAHISPAPKPYDVTGAIIAFESGELDTKGTLELFSHLIKTGMAWSLQGSYGRAAKNLMDNGSIGADGTIHESLQ